MKKLLIIFVSFILLSCAGKAVSTDEPTESIEIVDVVAPAITDETPAAPITPMQEKPDTDVYVTVIATGFGDTEREAITDARREAVVAASEIALENGDAYVSDFKLIFDNLPQRETEFVKSAVKVTGKGRAIEIAARVNYTKLTDAINALNTVIYHIPLKEAPVSASVEGDKLKKERIVNEFSGLFGDLNDVMAVKIESIDYNQAQVRDGMIPFQVTFVLFADPEKYQQKAQRMVDIVTRELGGKLILTVPVTYIPSTDRDLGYFGAELKGILNEQTYATVIAHNGKEVVEVYRLSEHYRRFFNQTYRDEIQIGNPNDIQLRLRLSDSAGDLIYEDFMQPFRPRTGGEQNASEMEGVYPAVYILNKHENTDYNGRFRIGSYDADLYSAIRLQVDADNYFGQSLIGDHYYDKHPYKTAVTAPYILADVGFYHSNHSAKEIRLQYEGLISIADVKKLKSVMIDTVK